MDYKKKYLKYKLKYLNICKSACRSFKVWNLKINSSAIFDSARMREPRQLVWQLHTIHTSHKALNRISYKTLPGILFIM